MHTGLYLVRATGLKRRLEEAADSTANKLLDQIQTMARDSNDHICETYTRMAAGIGVVRMHTTANVHVLRCCLAVLVLGSLIVTFAMTGLCGGCLQVRKLMFFL